MTKLSHESVEARDTELVLTPRALWPGKSTLETNFVYLPQSGRNRLGLIGGCPEGPGIGGRAPLAAFLLVTFLSLMKEK